MAKLSQRQVRDLLSGSKYLHLEGYDLSGLDLRRVNLSLSVVALRGANLSRSDLRGANLREGDLDDTNLSEANLSGADLYWAGLIEANLRNADLSRANLVKAHLNGANLSGASLVGANLNEANLDGANLSGADLRNAKLDNAVLYDANLRGANLSGASLNGANLSGADLSGAIMPGGTKHAEEVYKCPKCGSRVSRDWGRCIKCNTLHPPASEQTQFLTRDIDCPKCGTTNNAGRQFCRNCGTAIVRVCPNCRVLNAWDAMHCGKCGEHYEIARREFIHRIKTALGEGVVSVAEFAPTVEERIRYAPDDAEMHSLNGLIDAKKKAAEARVAEAAAQIRALTERSDRAFARAEEEFRKLERESSGKKGCLTAILVLPVLCIAVLVISIF